MDSGFAFGAGGGLAHLLLWVALAVSLLVLGGWHFATRPVSLPPPRHPAHGLALVLPVIGYLVTLPTHAPFAAGHGLGVGFLLGGVGAWLLQVIDRPTEATEGDDRSSLLSPAALAAAALSVGAVLQFVSRSSVLDALMGCAMGWLVAGALLAFAPLPRRAPGIVAVGVAVALATAALLGVLRDGRATQTVPHGTWAASATLLVAVAALLVWLAGRIGTAPTPSNRPSPFVAAIPLGLTALAALVLAYKGVSELRLFALAVAGLLLWPVASRLLRLKEASSAPVLMSALLVVSGFLVGGQVMQGYGAALVIVMLWVGAACLGAVSAAERRVLLFATTLALFRGFAGRWGGDFVRSDAPSLGDQYALFGLVVGLAAPAVASAVARRSTTGRAGAVGAAIAVGSAGTGLSACRPDPVWGKVRPGDTCGRGACASADRNRKGHGGGGADRVGNGRRA